jgi:hypothetical protein
MACRDHLAIRDRSFLYFSVTASRSEVRISNVSDEAKLHYWLLVMMISLKGDEAAISAEVPRRISYCATQSSPGLPGEGRATYGLMV